MRAATRARTSGSQVGWDCGVDCCVERMQSLRAIGVHVIAWYASPWIGVSRFTRAGSAATLPALFPANRPQNRPAPTQRRAAGMLPTASEWGLLEPVVGGRTDDLLFAKQTDASYAIAVSPIRTRKTGAVPDSHHAVFSDPLPSSAVVYSRPPEPTDCSDSIRKAKRMTCVARIPNRFQLLDQFSIISAPIGWLSVAYLLPCNSLCNAV